MKTLTKTAGLFAAITIGLFITSCSKQSADISDEVSVEDSLVISSPTTETPPSSTTDTYAHVQFINANPSLGPLTLYVAGVQNGAGLNLYGEERGYYNTKPSFIREPVVIKSATGSTVKSTSSGFYAGQYYSLFYAGEKNNQEAILVADNKPANAPAAGTALIKFVNAAPASPLLDVVVNNTVIFGRQGYKANTPYVTVSAGTYPIKFNLYNTSTTATSIPAAVIQSGKVYTVYTRDDIQTGNKVVVTSDMFAIE
ncbi:DUF4397 domain-containing protein [Mucilaginibacter sp. HMF5004]|uniref:DUF4397 domain-containing protein n=1 Tax=Mucilaginibacter rivuli TaxID=2857527 RepID=UPI001C5CF757|nr:DUF4397 domain-containing protein [Mucilaginibacter rivuli]MBW4890875.1 DUF4397 domain-containing protein [Mucilaginibacter rivuli]